MNKIININVSRKRAWKPLLAVLMAVLVAGPTVAAADILVIDQANDSGHPSSCHSIPYFSPTGQEFTPALYAADMVELYIFDPEPWADEGPPPGAELQVKLREDTITGSVIGTSSVVSLPEGFWDPVRFDFPSFVPLTPGSRYVIEITMVSSDNWGVCSKIWDAEDYPGGRMISLGEPVEDDDMWFRVGIAHSIPETKDQCRQEGWQTLVRADGTPFKNQGRCIRYVNIGK